MTAQALPLPTEAAKPLGAREFTWRAAIVAMGVAAVIGASYPYVVLKLGFGPNISVVSAFFGYLALGLLFRNFHRWENNIVQTAGTSAGQTAFLCPLNWRSSVPVASSHSRTVPSRPADTARLPSGWNATPVTPL